MRRIKRRIRINYGRFIISLMVLSILLLLIIKVSKKTLANNHNENTITPKEEVIVQEDISLHSKDLNINTEDDSKDIEKADKIDQKEPVEGEESKTREHNDYKEVFKDDLFLGDSITDSLSFYDILDESNIIAKFGLTTRKSTDIIDNIIKKNPRNIYIMLGTNDILTGEGSQKFIEDYTKLVQIIKEKLPDTNIYINSILPVKSKVKDKKPLLTNENIDEFNKALVTFAKDENIQYLDIASIFEDDIDLIEPDGIHVKYKFYKLWLDFIIERMDEND